MRYKSSMIGNNLEQDIISVFQKNLSSTFSINQVAKALHKAYPYINKKANYFLDEGILKKISIGRSYQCFLNMKSEKTKILMSINEINKKYSFLKKNPWVSEFQSRIDTKEKVVTIIISKKSIIIVFEKEPVHYQSAKQFLRKYLEDAEIKNYELFFMSIENFKREIMSTYSEDSIIIHNVDVYLAILSEISDKLLLKGLINNAT